MSIDWIDRYAVVPGHGSGGGTRHSPAPESFTWTVIDGYLDRSPTRHEVVRSFDRTEAGKAAAEALAADLTARNVPF